MDPRLWFRNSLGARVMTRTPLVAGNWKMNGSLSMTRDLVGGIVAGMADVDCELLVCPPAPLILAAFQASGGTRLMVGGQDCHAAAAGAHTGDVAAEMLADMGCGHVIVGHSERRQDHGETDADVAAKAAAALRAGLVAIICVGETEAERDAGETADVIARQLDGSVPEGTTAETIVIAYEPVWAIGTGRTPTAEEANAVHRQIREHLKNLPGGSDALRILYGGSMKPGNAAEFLAWEDIDGGLIGGAALKAEDFLAIARAASA
jgi:triosephosphate isomerase